MTFRLALATFTFMPLAVAAASLFVACSSDDNASPPDAAAPHDASIAEASTPSNDASSQVADAGHDAPILDAYADSDSNVGPDAGHIDPTFGDGGSFVLPIDYVSPFAGTGSVRAMRTRADGRIVALLTAPGADGGVSTFIVQLLADGSGLDPSFAIGGFLRVATVSSAAFALQDDGKIVVAGRCSNQTTCVSRLLPDGSADVTFGAVVSAGARSGTTTFFGGGADTMLIDRQGRTLIGVAVQSFYPGEIDVTRFTTAGDIDLSFGSKGTLSVALTTYASLVGIAQQTNGRLVFAGRIQTGTVAGQETTAPLVFSTFDDGTFDSTFGSANTAAPDAGLPFAFTLPSGPAGAALSIDCANDNEITIMSTSEAAYYPPDPATNLTVAKLTSTGALDLGFADGGVAFLPLFPYQPATAIAPATASHFVLTGQSNQPCLIARVLADGSVDPTLGGVRLPPSFNSCSAIVAQGPGAVVAVSTLLGTRPTLSFVRVR